MHLLKCNSVKHWSLEKKVAVMNILCSKLASSYITEPITKTVYVSSCSSGGIKLVLISKKIIQMCKNNTGVHIIGNTKYCINSVAKAFKRFPCIITIHFIAEQILFSNTGHFISHIFAIIILHNSTTQ